MADNSEWVSFDEDENLAEKQPSLLDKPIEKAEFLSSDAYISLLENKLNKIKVQDPSKVTSKDLLESMQQARESHFERLLKNDGQISTVLEFITDDNTNSCFTNMHIRMFPKQPINTQELECLVDDDNDEKT